MSLRLCIVAVALALSSSCNSRPEPPQPAAAVASNIPSQETFALGNQLTPVGAVAESAVHDSFYRGSALFLSVDVGGASSPQEITVLWNDARGRVLRSEKRRTSRARYVTFSAQGTERWKSGAHKAVIVINGRKVAEKPFLIHG